MDCVLESEMDKQKRILHMYVSGKLPHSLGKDGRKHFTCRLFLLEDSAPSQIFLFHIQVEAYLCTTPCLYCTPGGPCKGLNVFHNIDLCHKDLWDQEVLGRE